MHIAILPLPKARLSNCGTATALQLQVALRADMEVYKKIYGWRAICAKH